MLEFYSFSYLYKHEGMMHLLFCIFYLQTLWGTFENSNVKISPVSDNQKSSEFVFSKLIGQGCNSAVYSAFEKLCKFYFLVLLIFNCSINI